VASYADDRFLVAWESFTGLASSFDLMAQRFEAAPPPPAPAAPSVTALSQESLLIAWAASSEASLQSYAVYVDGATTPVLVSSTSWEAGGFAPASTHSFRLAYVLEDRGRSLLSEPASGTTLSNEAPAVAKSASNVHGADGAASFAANPGGAPRIDIALTDKGVTLRWNTESGGIYQAQVSTNLSSWADLGSPRSAAGASDSMNIEAASGARFYRVMRVR
jgi:hypothetical protein